MHMLCSRQVPGYASPQVGQSSTETSTALQTSLTTQLQLVQLIIAFLKVIAARRMWQHCYLVVQALSRVVHLFLLRHIRLRHLPSDSWYVNHIRNFYSYLVIVENFFQL